MARAISRPPLGTLALLLVAGCPIACVAGSEKHPPPGSLGTNPVDAGAVDAAPFDVGRFNALEIDPINAIVTIDLATDPPTPGRQHFTAHVTRDDGTLDDVSNLAAFEVEYDFGSFALSDFKSWSTLPNGKPGTTLVTAQLVDADGATRMAAANLTLVALRASGASHDFFFVEPYQHDPSPASDVLRFGTRIQQLDVAFSLDTTGSMQPVIDGLKSTIGSMIPRLQAAIPDVGVAIAGHDDFPYPPFGSSGDLPFYLLHTVTTSLAAAETATNGYQVHGGGDDPESQIESMFQILSGAGVSWPGGSLAKKTNAPNTYGYVDFRPGSLPVVVEITDAPFHDAVDYTGASAHSYSDLLGAYADTHARFIGVAIGPGDGGGQSDSSPFPQMTSLADDSHSYVPPTAFGTSCGIDVCCTDELGGARLPDASDGKSCLLVFKAPYGGAATSDGIVSAITALAAGSTFDVHAVALDDPSDGFDATHFIRAVRAMGEGDPASGCPATEADDTDGDGLADTFRSIPVGTPVCFEVIPAENVFVPATKQAQFFNAFIRLVGMPGAVNLDQRSVLFLVPPADVPR